MSKVTIELDSAGIRALLKSDAVAEVCEAQAKRMTLATGMRYEPDVFVGRNRVNAGGYDKEETHD